MFSFSPEVPLSGLVERAHSGRALAVVDVTVIDGLGGRPQEHQTVLIRDGIIVDIMRSGEPPGPDVDVINGPGWLIPGLIDCHVHLNGEQTWDAYRRYLEPDADLKLFHAQRHAAAALASGFTTLRDVGLGHAVTLREASKIGLIEAPRILAANSAISSTGGHGDWTIFPYEWARHMNLRGTIADGVDECRRAVRLAFRGGADLIKVMPSGGGITNHPHDLRAHPEFSLEEVSAIVEEAHRRNARVAAHTNGREGAELAIRAGADTIEHGVFEPEPRILNEMAERRISLVPTLYIFDWVVRNGRQAGVFEGGIEAAKLLLETQFRLVASAQRAGVNVALGTDNNGVLGLDTSASEAGLLAHAGLTNLEAIGAATRSGAIACGLEDLVGSIRTGMNADLVLLARDPTRDISSLWTRGSIQRVIQAPTGA